MVEDDASLEKAAETVIAAAKTVEDAAKSVMAAAREVEERIHHAHDHVQESSLPSSTPLVTPEPETTVVIAEETSADQVVASESSDAVEEGKSQP